MKLKKYLAVGVIALAAFSAGRFLGPAKVEIKEVERVVYRERVEEDKSKSVTETKKETTLPDGTKIVETERREDSESRTTTETDLDHTKISEKTTENRPGWRVGATYLPPLPTQKERYGLVLERRLFSEIYAGVLVQTDQTIGVSISLGF